jgi:molybdopterin-guanine dinucleotide biosynthesis protein A
MPMTRSDNITGILLVGGKSRRMGRDKALLEIDDKPIIERVLEAFRARFDQIALVGDRPERFAEYELPVIPDIYPGSPLGGIYTGLYHARTEYIFVSSCDIPFPNVEIISHLCSLINGFDAVVPVVAHGYEPLFAVYSKTCLGPIRTSLESGNRCAYAYYPQVRIREVPREELAHLDRQGNAFLAINTPEEYVNIGGKPWQ